MLTLGSLFDGSGTFPVAGMLAGIKPVWSSEIEPFPIRVTTKRLPFVKHYGDISTLNGAELEPVDIITFGSPCFPAGTLVLTNEGFVEIENITVGMKVLTHKGRWRKVTAVGSKIGKTIILKDNHYGLECTPNHPIYSAERQFDNSHHTTISEEKNWTPAEDMQGKLWAVPSNFDKLPIPALQYSGDYREKQFSDFSDKFFYLVGRWLGDGWVRDEQRHGRPKGQTQGTILICTSYKKEPFLKKAVENMVENYSVERCRTAVKYKFYNKAFCSWLTENFGKYAHGKTMPAWAFSMPESFRKSLLQGIFDTDGYHVNKNHFRVTTVSKKLAFGMRILGETLGYSTSVFYDKRPDFCFIEGRKVRQRPSYNVQFIKSESKNRLNDTIHSWYGVRKILQTDEAEKVVYNLTVDEDNSYTADGIVVHNCTDLSIAGKRAGLNAERSGLFFQAIRIIKEMRCATNGKYPRFAVWENVSGAFSSNGGEDFRTVLEEFCKIKEPDVSVPKPEKWTKSGEILGNNYSVAYRTFDAQYWNTPQRRVRIYLVADFDGGCASKILFESEGLSGYSAASFRAWQAASRSAENCSGTAGTGLVFSNHGQDTRFKGPVDVAETISASYGTGGNNQPFVVESAGFCTEHSAKARGIGYEKETSPTLRAGVVPATLITPKVYGICSKHSNSMMSDNPNSGFYEAETSRTIDTSGTNPSSNQGGIVVLEGNGSRPSHHGDGYKESDTMYCLNCTENHGVAYKSEVHCIDQGGGKSSCCFYENQSPTLTCTHGGEPAVSYGIGRPAMNQSFKAKFSFQIEEEKSPTIVASGAGGVSHPKYSTSKNSHHMECHFYSNIHSPKCYLDGYQHGVEYNL